MSFSCALAAVFINLLIAASVFICLGLPLLSFGYVFIKLSKKLLKTKLR